MHRNKIIFILLAIIIASSCTKKTDLGIENQKKFMDYYICKFLKKKSIILLNEPLELNSSPCLLDFINNQKNIKFRLPNIDNQKWVRNLIPKAQLITRAETPTIDKLKWVDFKKQIGKGFFIISKPIFSFDYKYVLINVSYYCDERCGYQKSQLFKKDKNNSWILLNSYCESDN